MILLLVEMMNQSLGTCPNFGVHFKLRQHGGFTFFGITRHYQHLNRPTG